MEINSPVIALGGRVLLKERNMSKTEELLAVLDMTEERQWNYVANNRIRRISESLADLANRLQSESDIGSLIEASDIIWKYLNKNDYVLSLSIDDKIWWAFVSKPIHKIVNALIAKEISHE